MPYDPPHTPQSPSQSTFGLADLPAKAVSPKITHSLPTPAHSINGSMSSIGDIAPESSLLEDISNKRKRDVDDHGDRDQKKVHLEDGRLSIEDLHVDVGSKYLLCRTPHVRTRPDTTQDLFELYGFNDLAKSVARKTPGNTDGKSIRKTYKSVFKGLSGNFDVDKKEMDAPDTLFAMMQMPADEWDAQMCRGKDIAKGLPESVLASMSKAFTMARGPIPKAAWNNSVLGDIIVAPAAVRPAVKAAAKPTSTVVRPLATQPVGVQRLARDIPRPKRSVTKRTYGDTSYEGYGEGYVDDEMQDTGYSDGDDENRRKRAKKASAGHTSFQQGQMRQNSYGPGMVGA